MTTLSIHNLDPETERRIRALARRQGRSLNQVLQQLLRKALGDEPDSSDQARKRFAGVFGAMPDEEADALLDRLREERRIDPEDWR